MNDIDPLPRIFVRLGCVAVPVVWYLSVRVFVAPRLVPDLYSPRENFDFTLWFLRSLVSLPITILSLALVAIFIRAICWAVTGRDIDEL